MSEQTSEISVAVSNEAQPGCPVCATTDGHKVVGCNWWECQECGCTWDEDRRDEDSMPWKCYHCGEVCNTYDDAHKHFGPTQYSKPVCQIDAAQLREMEETMRRYQEEDTDLHRQVLSMSGDKQRGFREGEEVGYARGLADAKEHPQELGLRVDDGEPERLKALINSPELENFLRAVHIEAVHQVERWGTAHDRAKRPADWFWLVGYLGGKALHSAVSGDQEKALHHCISTAAALYNWHSAIKGTDVRMCPGRSDLAELVDAGFPGSL